MKKIFAAMPLITTILGAGGLGYLAIRFIASLTIGGVIIASLAVILYCYWMMWESKISVDELNKSSEHKDYHTMELAALAKIITLTLAFVGGSVVHYYLAIPGIMVMIYGVRLRQYAIIALGRQYSHRLRIPEGVCEDGPYNFLRHPAYIGTFIIHIGFVMVFFNEWAVLSVCVLWGGAVLLRTLVEERMFKEHPEYQKYAERVKYKLIPGIW